VVRITTNLVQVDAVVTDKGGRQVIDLKPEDFEILEDGKPQRITNFSYISTAPPVARAAAPPTDENTPPAPPTRLRPGQARRTLALVVDDLHLSFENTVVTRDALRKFVDQQMQPDDLVAIFITGKELGVLQQFTSDKQQLYDAISRVRYNLMARSDVDQFDPVEPYLLPEGGARGGPIPRQRAAEKDAALVNFRRQMYTRGTMGALQFIVNHLRALPGRKSLVLFSEGDPSVFPAEIDTSGDRDSSGGQEMLNFAHKLVDAANRNSVTIYSIDPRGLQAPLDIRDQFSASAPEAIAGTIQARTRGVFVSQLGLRELAEKTGGFLVKNTNDITGGFRRIIDDLKGYYLIAYRPDESTFDPATRRPRFHSLKIRVKRPGLQVRSRSGFIGVSGKDGPLARDADIIGALVSPFASEGVRVRLTPLFANDPQLGSFMHSLLHVDARDLTFTQEPDGWRKAILDVMGVTFGDNGQIADRLVNSTYTLRVREKNYERLLQNGFVYTVDFAVKKPGAYQLRFSLRDAASRRVGSAGQFIVVPNLGSGRLALSGIIVRGRTGESDGQAQTPGGAPPASPPAAPGEGQADQDVLTSDVRSSPGVRRFRPGMVLDYVYMIYNARTTSASPRPRLTARARLFREGKLLYTGEETPVGTDRQEDLKRLGVLGQLHLSANAEPGEYALQIVVTDLLAPEKHRTVSRWIDFEIVK
jgi:VWFA-related protein